MTDEYQTSAIARSLPDGSVQAIIAPGGGPRGPWPLLADTPRTDRPMLAPPPVYYALAGWAA